MQYILPTGRSLAFAAAKYGNATERATSPVRTSRDRADTDPAQSGAVATRRDVAAWARHASAANGFGDAATDSPTADMPATATHGSGAGHVPDPGVRSSLPAQWSRGIVARIRALDRALFRMLLRSLTGALSRWHERRRRDRSARDICMALGGLDAHSLRDLGFHRSEIPSFAAEMTGGADATRVRSGKGPRTSTPRTGSPIVAISPSFQGELRHAP